jgi:hypothetical protein
VIHHCCLPAVAWCMPRVFVLTGDRLETEMTDILRVPRAPFDMEDPWASPEDCEPVRLRCATDAGTPRLSTSVAVWFDDAFLSVLFSLSDDHIHATLRDHDAPLYEQDVVEIFLAPETLTRYFELEVSPLGTVFDAAVESPDGVRSTMRVDRSWNCEGLMTAVRRVTESDGIMTVDTLVRLPFDSLGRPAPVRGETWRANFFRIDRHPDLGDEFSAWQPTLRHPPDFHVPAVFGILDFDR